MDNYIFSQMLEDELQKMTLSDPHELHAIASHRRGMERDAHKSYLREREYGGRQLSKIRCWEIIRMDPQNYILGRMINGKGEVLKEEVLFACILKGVRKYKREGADYYEWQAVILEYWRKSEVESCLYKEDSIRSIAKLKTTIFAQYEYAATEEGRKQGWEWLHKELVGYWNERMEIVHIPSKAGWYRGSDKWHFWTGKDEDVLLLNETIKKFSINNCDYKNAEEVVGELATVADEISEDRYVGILLIFRMISLLGRLGTEQPFYAGLTLVGERAELVAKAYLSTMINEIDIANLDSDRIGDIRKRARLIRDNPLILISSNPDSKSAQNRIGEVLGWKEAGYIEGELVQIPFVFCLKKFARTYPLDGMVVLDAKKISVCQGMLAFAKLQSWLIDTIENSGNFWVEEFQKKFSICEWQYQEEDRLIPLVEAVVSIVMRIFEVTAAEGKTCQKFEKLLRAGINEIRRQFSNTGCLLIELFKETTLQQVNEKRIAVMETSKEFVRIGPEKIIFYDFENYYLDKEVFDFICQQAAIDDKSILHIKQQLAEQGFLKMYRSCSSTRELEIDFRVKDIDGQWKKKSGIAIKKIFWDVVGGIALFERGK